MAHNDSDHQDSALSTSRIYQVPANALSPMKKSIKKSNRKARKAASTVIELPDTDLDAALSWLESLGEPKFRDSVLAELFSEMKRRGDLLWFENIHGRHDKGVDFLVVTKTAFDTKLVGIQVKGKPLTRTGTSSSLSAVAVASECENAMKWEFSVNGTKQRLDSIAVWCSAHVTQDAEEEFTKPGLGHRITLKKPRDIFPLIDNYVPRLLASVPQLSLVKYLRASANPEPEAIRVLGCPLSPNLHFLEPSFTESTPDSLDSLEKKAGQLRPKKRSIALDELLQDARHLCIFSNELSGKSYLLKRCRTLLAQRKSLSILLNAAELTETPRSPSALASGVMGILTPQQVDSLSQSHAISLLVDDLDRAPSKVREWLFGLDPQRFRVIAAGRSVAVPSHVYTVHIAGTRLSSLPRFLRSLNPTCSRAVIDRAHAYIERTLIASRLPQNAFTISIMLQECQRGSSRFSTPTMGRLIERFVELQLGSHSDVGFNVDFETKRDFLSHLAGKDSMRLTRKDFARRLSKFIETSKHPQSVSDFVSDFQRSGVFIFSDSHVEWAHPAFRLFFWVRNLVQNKRFGILGAALRKSHNPTLSAIVGSQVLAADLPAIFDPLINELSKAPLPDLQALLPEHSVGSTLPALVVNDEEEDAMLQDIENADDRSTRRSAHPLAQLATTTSLEVASGEIWNDEDREDSDLKIDEETKKAIRTRIVAWLDEVAQTRLELAFNLASLLMNARRAKHSVKQQALDALLRKAKEFGHLLRRFYLVIFPDNRSLVFSAGWHAFYSELHIADRMLGDPFLVNVLRGMLSDARSHEEKLQILDLLLSCGEDVGQDVVEILRAVGRHDVNWAVYMRVATLYYFRFHKDVDRSSLRRLLREIRAADKTRLLPVV